MTEALGSKLPITDIPPFRMILSSSTIMMFGSSTVLSIVSNKMLMSISKHLEIRSSRTASGIRRPVSQFAIVLRSTNSISASCCWDRFFSVLNCFRVSAKESFMCVSSHGSILYLFYYKGCAFEIQHHSKRRCHALTHLIVLWRIYDRIILINSIQQRKIRMETRIDR